MSCTTPLALRITTNHHGCVSGGLVVVLCPVARETVLAGAMTKPIIESSLRMSGCPQASG